jgi:microcin C transport system permease protein
MFILSPMNLRRLNNFKANRRGYWSFWVFIALFGLSLCSELIANDKPLIAKYKGEFIFPALITYPPAKFGDDLIAYVDYRDPFIADEINKNGWMVFPLIPYSDTSQIKELVSLLPQIPPRSHPLPPTWAFSNADCQAVALKKGGTWCSNISYNWLGTDGNARDVAARLIYGFRISVIFGLTLTLFASIIGVIAGAVQGYFGGWTDLLMQRGIEIWSSIPTLYVLLIMSNFFQPGFWTLFGILMLFSWTALVHVVRAEFLRARNFEYVKAARALGLNNITIMWRHILPNAMVATLTFLPFLINSSISTLTALDFLGLGMPAGSPSLGELLLQARNNLQAPWLAISAFMVIATMLSLLIFIGEAVRDAFDPRKAFS